MAQPHPFSWLNTFHCVYTGMEISGQGIQNCLFLAAPAMQCSAAQLLSDALNETCFPTLQCSLENKV